MIQRSASRWSAPLFLVLALTATACGPAAVDGPEPEAEPGVPPLPAAPPVAPNENDPAFGVSGVPQWSIVADGLNGSTERFEVEVSAPAGVRVVDAWLGSTGVRLDEAGGEGENRFVGSLSLAGYRTGDVTLLLSADASDGAFAQFQIRRSHPLYVLVGTDWDDADNADSSYTLQAELHDLFPELRITHFVGPYTWTDPTVSEERVAFIEAWLHGMVDSYDDEVAVHIHPYCNFVETTSVLCRTTPSVVYDEGDASGYTVESAAYTEAEYTELLLATDLLFEAAGFAKPVSFRAGAWTLDMSTLRAVANANYTVDSNAYNWARMEEWIGLGNGGFYDWVSTNWSEMDDVSQPYYPSNTDIQVAGSDIVPVLEIPLNGVMVDYVTGPEMVEIFDANWDGTALEAPVTFAIGYHPPNFDLTYQTAMIEALGHVSGFLASDGSGPVVHATFEELTRVYPRPGQ